jgi:hypothetical protein
VTEERRCSPSPGGQPPTSSAASRPDGSSSSTSQRRDSADSAAGWAGPSRLSLFFTFRGRSSCRLLARSWILEPYN